MLFIRSLLFFVWFALVSAVLAILYLPTLLLPRKVIVTGSRFWSRCVLFGLKWIAGLGYEVRGRVPSDAVLIAAKHMSMWDTVTLYLVLYDPAVVLKAGLRLIPFYGWYTWKAGSIAIDRDGKASALRKMGNDAKAAMAEGRSVLIFPEGTRKSPGMPPDYKPGVAGLYGQLDVPCVPVALNSAQFWTGPFWRKSGRIVVEFLPAIPPGLKRREFMVQLQDRIESATAALLTEGQVWLDRRNSR
ncbi:MAG TPA: lysophospholipid acyltransferase family protein [Rhizomicrobium sp.]|nr:lysophospholipid acyltransferase family protein [Rhizomicrobium sp.]